MIFKNRAKELEEMSEVLDSSNFELLILYGRRRVGKTELTLQATKNRKRVYYLATEEKNLERFYNTCTEFDSRVTNLKMDYEVLFDYIKEKAEVVVIDEFQNMIKEEPKIVSTLQSIVDTKLKNSKLKLILLGSSISLMTSKVLSYQSPLYGRRTASIKLKPITFPYLHHFFPEANAEELVEIYGFADGIPHYLNRIRGRFWDWLEKEIKTEKTFIRDEADFMMRYEFENPRNYKLILEAIANGKNKINEIKDYMKVQRTDITPYIKNLIELDLIKREVPIKENQNSRNGRYSLNDNFLTFWFHYIYSNLSTLEEGAYNIKTIKKTYSTYLGPIFEKIAKQHTIKNNPGRYTKIGRWWYKDQEIDLIALNEDTGEVNYVECKWQDKVDAEKTLQQLKEKTKHIPWRTQKMREHYTIYAKTFKNKQKPQNTTLIDLKKLTK